MHLKECRERAIVNFNQNQRYINKMLKIVCRAVFLLFLCLGSSFPACADEDIKLEEYQNYQQRFESIKTEEDIKTGGFKVIGEQVFSTTFSCFGTVDFVPAFDEKYHRLAIFLVGAKGKIVYKTDQLETNSQIRGELEQPNKGIAAVSFQDVNFDGLTDIILITSCGSGKGYKTGDVLFQNARGFYRDWRVSDKINRFGMNKSIRFVISFVKDGYSTEFLYTATTLDKLLEQGFKISEDQTYWRQFEKLGRLNVVPGTYKMAEYSVFMIYLVNEQGYIVWSFQPMEDYENLYELKGITCRDIDGDGLKDIVVLAGYSFEGNGGESVIRSDYSIYYQRTGGFYTDKEFKSQYQCNDSDTLGELVEKARAYWGWESEI